MKLNTLNTKGHKYKRWCGPSALSIITGRTLKYCHNKLAKIAGKKPQYLKGVKNWQMRKALEAMGYEMFGVSIPLLEGERMMHTPTLRKWIDEIQNTKQFRSVMLINVTNHYVVAHRGLVCDNQEQEPRPPAAHHSGRQRIEYAWIVRRKKR